MLTRNRQALLAATHKETQRFKRYDATVRAPLGARGISAGATETLRLFAPIGLAEQPIRQGQAEIRNGGIAFSAA